MILQVENNMTPIDGKIVAFLSKGKIRVGEIIIPTNGVYKVKELVTDRIFYPYTQELIEVGNESSCDIVQPLVKFKKIN